MSEPITRRVWATDHETLVTQAGEHGPAVVLLHALGLDRRMWEPVLGPLSAGRRVFAYDIRGHGHAAGAPTPFRLADTATDLVAVLDALEVEWAHLVGLSYGGGIAQTVAAHQPERLASLSLLATTDEAFGAFEDRARAAETDGMAAQVPTSLARWFTPEGLADDGWGVRYARDRVAHFRVADWAATWRAFAGLDVRGKLADLGVPVLVLAGERDVSTTPAAMTALAERIPGSTYRELPGIPHLMTLERPEVVTAALADFLPTA
ncbi:MAG TPA: alpha/beta fold hydrolase [Pseudonocardiaceae bacterium]|jgi:3-oxoadipate enol-lactonase|nr:alpha/beta fold hydrolase [Pseudonocardiaceae bacterium]